MQSNSMVPLIAIRYHNPIVLQSIPKTVEYLDHHSSPTEQLTTTTHTEERNEDRKYSQSLLAFLQFIGHWIIVPAATSSVNVV